jgi:hypothetical protein
MDKGKWQKDKQYNGQREMTKGFGHYIVCPLSFTFYHYIVCRFVIFLWPLYCLSFSRFSFGHYIIWPFVAFLLPLYCLLFCRFPLAIRTNNIMVKWKTTKGQKIELPKEYDKRTNKIMAKGKKRKRQTV